MELLLLNRFELRQMVGEGSFGKVYQAFDKHTGQDVAVKIEDQKDPQKKTVLRMEYKILKHIKKSLLDKQINPPILYPILFGKQDNYSIMVMELGLNSIQNLVEKQPMKKFGMKTILMLAIRMTNCLEMIHKCNIIHRDIKPSNFMITIYNDIRLIDFGLAKKYQSSIFKTSSVPFVGTCRYASINTHRGKTYRKVDDIESMLYSLIYLYNGKLPWQGIKAPNKKIKYNRVRQKKENLSASDICQCPGLTNALDYIRGLGSQPFDYNNLKKLFKQALKQHGWKDDNIFNWTD